MKAHKLARLVKSEDLNHHGTLFAGRMAEWFVEGCFISAASEVGNPNKVVCLKMHGLKFRKPARKGDIIYLETKVVLVGNTSITVYGAVTRNGQEEVLVDGFVTFVTVDENGNKEPHGLKQPVASNEGEKELMEIAKSLS